MAPTRALRSGRWIIQLLLLLIIACTGQAQETPAAPVEPETKPDYAAVARVLEDEASRNRLIAELKALADAPEEEAESLIDGIGIPVTAPRELAGETRDLVESIAEEFSNAANAVASIDFSDRSGTGAELAGAAFNLAVVLVVSVVIYIGLHRLFFRVHIRAADWVSSASSRARVLRHLAAVLVPLLTALISVALAWGCAYLIALYLLGAAGQVPLEVALFLNAFIILETARVVLESLLSPRYPRLRLLPLQSASAHYWNRWLGGLIAALGYGLLVVAPVLSDTFSPALGEVVALVLILAGYLTVLTLIFRNRQRVRLRLLQGARRSAMGLSRALLGVIARIWHILALLYVTALVLVTINDPDQGLATMARATLQTLLAIGLGGLLSSTLTKLIGRRLELRGSMRRWSPALERRLNRYLPTWMKVIRVIIALVVIAVILDAWTGFELDAWAKSPAGAWLLGSATTVGIIITLAALLWIVAATWIERRLEADGPTTAERARQRTLLGLFRNAIAITILIITTMIVLSELGINIAPLIASAGVLGLAIGFGAQKLVQDIITGVFIQLENAINTGDVVTAGGFSGEAEKLTIRSLGLRDLEGTYHIIPFSSVDTVSNFMRGFSYHLGAYGIAYREDTDEALAHMKAAFEDLRKNPEQSPFILEDLEVHGVTELGDSAVTLRVRIKTLPGKQWGVGREYNRLVKKHFDAAGIEIPYPHMTLYFGQDKDGKAPPAPIKLTGDPEAASEEIEDLVRRKEGRHDTETDGKPDVP